MGSGIAAVSALAGNPTIIVDVDRDKAKGGVTDALKCVRESVPMAWHLTGRQDRQRDCLSRRQIWGRR